MFLYYPCCFCRAVCVFIIGITLFIGRVKTFKEVLDITPMVAMIITAGTTYSLKECQYEWKQTVFMVAVFFVVFLVLSISGLCVLKFQKLQEKRKKDG